MAAPIYPYTPNTPNAGNPQDQTQLPILNNFRAISELLSVNHGPFNSSNSGKHKFITMPFPSTVTEPSSTDLNMFSAATPDGPNLAEIYTTSSNGQTTQISNISTGGPAPTGTGSAYGCQFSDTGLIMKWGTATIDATYSSNDYFYGGFGTYTFPTGSDIPAFTYNIFYISVTPTSIPSGCDYGGFVAYYNNAVNPYFSYLKYIYLNTLVPGTYSFNYFVIGI